MISQNKFIRTHFMREFTRQLILNSERQPIAQETQGFSQSILTTNLQSFSNPAAESSSKITELDTQDQSFYSAPTSSQPLATTKIGILLNDVSIQAIECSGPNKPISIKRNNQVISTPITLDENEIEELINAISKESNSPIEENVLKASTPSYNATAFISDFVGSRFTIYKII